MTNEEIDMLYEQMLGAKVVGLMRSPDRLRAHAELVGCIQWFARTLALRAYEEAARAGEQVERRLQAEQDAECDNSRCGGLQSGIDAIGELTITLRALKDSLTTETEKGA